MEAEGDLDKVRLEIPESSLISLKSTGNVRSLFSLDYLNDIVKSLGKAEQVSIDLGSDYPVNLPSASPEATDRSFTCSRRGSSQNKKDGRFRLS